VVKVAFFRVATLFRERNGISILGQNLVGAERTENEGANAEVVENDRRLPALDEVAHEEGGRRNPPAQVLDVEDEHGFLISGVKGSLRNQGYEAANDGDADKDELCLEGLVATQDGKLGTALLDDEVEDPVESFADPPTNGGAFVKISILCSLDVAEESVENVVLDGDDSQYNEGHNRDNGDDVLKPIQNAVHAAFVFLYSCDDQKTTKEEKKRL